jgi:hypothetical protein
MLPTIKAAQQTHYLVERSRHLLCAYEAPSSIADMFGPGQSKTVGREKRQPPAEHE